MLAIAAIVLLAAPFAIAWHLYVRGQQVTEQFATAATTLAPAAAMSAARAGAGLPTRTPPVVLAYHDIRPLTPSEQYPDPTTNPKYHLVVTPEQFDAQLTALKAAGYTSISTDQYVDYLNGGPVPERSVLITFDDGTHGLWTHADKILQRHGMRGVAFLITANVGANRPYYLSWQEIDRMAQTGRWDFESHTRKMHARLPVNEQGLLASELVHRRWLSESHRSETLEEFESKIRKDLVGSVDDIIDHGLPRPRLFAYPFSEGFRASETSDPEAAAVTTRVVRELFAASFNNAPPRPLPSGARAADANMVGRVEIAIDTSLDDMLAKVRAHTPVTPRQAPVSDRTDLWTTNSGRFTTAGNSLTLQSTRSWQQVTYGPYATADWASYRGFVTVSGLTAPDTSSASVVLRVGSDLETSAVITAGRVKLVKGVNGRQVVLDEQTLAPGETHTVDFSVDPRLTVITVDHSVNLTAHATGGPTSYGGIGLAGYRDSASAPWPSFSTITVRPQSNSVHVRDGVGLPDSQWATRQSSRDATLSRDSQTSG
ncbi:polysaccharide deacetylase family protein [Gordonia sp. CPCC 205515]|uniref:polysaccharide deacetylase family protein n=1 Tax=Gordonia sp. CPCC 205515 TaxID=3140791 RepID=UPI003AF3EB68